MKSSINVTIFHCSRCKLMSIRNQISILTSCTEITKRSSNYFNNYNASHFLWNFWLFNVCLYNSKLHGREWKLGKLSFTLKLDWLFYETVFFYIMKEIAMLHTFLYYVVLLNFIWEAAKKVIFFSVPATNALSSYASNLVTTFLGNFFIA